MLRFYQNSDGSTADLAYDDQSMTASGVQVHVPTDAKPVTVSAVIAEQPVDAIYPPGTDAAFSFGTDLPVVLQGTWKGTQGLSMPWFGSFSVSVGN